MKIKIENNIKDTNDQNFFQKSIELFEIMGYPTALSFDDFSGDLDFFKSNIVQNTDKKFNLNTKLSNWKKFSFLFAINEDTLNQKLANNLFKTSPNDNIQGYSFIGIILNDEHFSKTELVTLTREINKFFPMPVLILFKYGNKLSLSVIHRRPNKTDSSRDVIERQKVSIIKDINIEKPHRGHIDILAEISIQNMFGKTKITSIDDLHQALMKVLKVELLNKKFYQELANWYFYAQTQCEFPVQNYPDMANFKPEQHTGESLIRLITRMLFVWFLKAKGLVPDDLFNKSKLSELLNYNDPSSSTYYKAILQNLFFATLNTPRKGEADEETRIFIDEAKSKKYINNGYLQQQYYRYKSFMKEPPKILEYFKDIPFLNGGLFESLDYKDENNKETRIDWFTNHKDKQDKIKVPDHVFFDDTTADLSKFLQGKDKSNVPIKALINLFESYVFTVEENTPIDEEVALTPHLLGSVFENLLANFNPETQASARKSTGSFYTPQEIVKYMVDESLKQYLITKFDESGSKKNIENDLEILLKDGVNNFSDDEAQLIINSIDAIKILDPACGSGAFPMGALDRMVAILKILDPDNDKWRQTQEKKYSVQAKDAFKLDKDARDEKLKEISENFENNLEDYGRKLYLIENTIYGVDIQPIAVQIAKLRFFLSLIIEQKIDDTKPNRGIKPLPNLETKLVAANTLIGLQEEEMQEGLFKSDDYIKLRDKLNNKRHELFQPKSYSEKKKLRNQEKDIRSELHEVLKNANFKDENAVKISSWDPYDQNKSSDWFDPQWMFGISTSSMTEGGFDVVIGNPPYVQVSKNVFSKEQFPFSEGQDKGKQNLYKVFVEAAYNFSKNNGIACLIVQSSLMCDISSQFTRELLLTKNKLRFVTEFPKKAKNNDAQVFETVLQGTCIYLAKKNIPNELQKFKISIDNDVTTINNLIFEQVKQKALIEYYPNGYFIPLIKPGEFDVIKKIFNQSVLLKEFILKIKKGDLSSDNDKSLFNKSYGKFLLIRGNNIKKYGLDKSFDKVIQNSKTEKISKQNYQNHIIAFQNITGTVDKHRIHCTLLSNQENIIFLDTTIKIFISDIVSSKKLLGVLNSKLLDWYFRKTSTNNHVNGYEIEQLPIPKISVNTQQTFIDLVDKILAKKEKGEDTTAEEKQIDLMVYKLYELTYDEVKIVEPDFALSEAEYEKQQK